jgi:hypothetical protein
MRQKCLNKSSSKQSAIKKKIYKKGSPPNVTRNIYVFRVLSTRCVLGSNLSCESLGRPWHPSDYRGIASSDPWLSRSVTCACFKLHSSNRSPFHSRHNSLLMFQVAIVKECIIFRLIINHMMVRLFLYSAWK